MKVTDFYKKVAKIADTPKQQIDAATVSRVLKAAASVLAKQKGFELADTLGRWIKPSKK